MKDGFWSWRVGENAIVIAPNARGRFALRLNGRMIGSYPSVEAALEEAVYGTRQPTFLGLRTVDLAPSDKITDWPFTKTL